MTPSPARVEHAPPWRHLVSSRWLRLTVFTATYFCQGIPIGLMTIALPAWLAQRGVGVAEVAAYLGVVTLPWGLKLLAGPFMDRFTFLPMGRRRPWVIAAQSGLVLAFLALLQIDDPLSELNAVIAIGFAISTFAALQDVAVDGMAIDVLPEAERGRANAFMAFGQVAGFSSFSAISGVLLARFGIGFAGAAAALTVAVVLVLIVSIRERPGEKLLPWTPGSTAPRTAAIPNRFAGIFKGLLKVLLLPMSLLLILTESLVRLRDGVSIAAIPVAATQTLGFSAEAYSNFQGAMGVAIAVAGIAIGPLIDRFGVKTFYLIGIGGSALTSLVFAFAEPLWSNTAFVIGAWSAANLFTQIIFVSFIACAMTLCWSPVAASQFAIYMSLSNLARAIGSSLFAAIADRLGVDAHFLLMSALLGAAFLALLFFRFEPHRARLLALDQTESRQV